MGLKSGGRMPIGFGSEVQDAKSPKNRPSSRSDLLQPTPWFLIGDFLNLVSVFVVD